MPEKSSGHRAVRYIPVFLLVVSVTLNVFLARKIRELRQIEASLRAEADLQPGETVPPLQVKTVEGNTISFQYGTSALPMVIYILSPSCTWCQRNEHSVEA